MSELSDKVELLKKAQGDLVDADKQFRMKQAVFEGVLKEVTKILGFPEDSKELPLADLIQKAMKAGKS